METIRQALRAHKSSLYLITGAVVLSFVLVSCGGGGGYGGGGSGMIALPPAAFSLSAPANMATGVGTTPTLTWTSSLYAAGYTVEISTTNTFATTVVSASVSATTYTVAPALAAGTYFWRVRATNIYGMYTAPTFSFTT